MKACTLLLFALATASVSAASAGETPVMSADAAIANLAEPLYASPTRPDRIGRILAPVMINGQGPFRLTVDTGANQSVITQRLAETLGLAASGRSIRLNGVTGAIDLPTVVVDRLETGAVM